MSGNWEEICDEMHRLARESDKGDGLCLITHELVDKWIEDMRAAKAEVARLTGDTRRLDFLLKYMVIDDVGDDEACPGVLVRSDSLEGDLCNGNRIGWDDNLRDVIDRATVKPEAES